MSVVAGLSAVMLLNFSGHEPSTDVAYSSFTCVIFAYELTHNWKYVETSYHKGAISPLYIGMARVGLSKVKSNKPW